MANDAYTKALKQVLTDASPPPETARTKAEIEADISAISERLKGPLSNVERLWLVEDRQILRKQLAVSA